MSIVWGPEIPVSGKPAWLERGTPVKLIDAECEWSGDVMEDGEHHEWWSYLTAIRVPASHTIYRGTTTQPLKGWTMREHELQMYNLFADVGRPGLARAAFYLMRLDSYWPHLLIITALLVLTGILL